MQIENSDTLDGLRVYWFGDNRLAYAPFGVTKSIPTSDDAWRLYSTDFNLNFDNLNSNTPWPGLGEWQGIRIDPTGRQNIHFAVDWIRLTDCAAVDVTINWQPVDGEVNIWAGIGRSAADFLATTVSGATGQTVLDVQGWEPGQYFLGVQAPGGAINWSASPLTIDAAPRLNITSPAFDSGNSIVWEMNSLEELDTNAYVGTRCVNYVIENGILDLYTLPASALSADCRNYLGGGVYISDPQLVLNLPVTPIDTQAYHYLTIRTYMEGQIQDINRGWMMRWLWKTYDNGDPQEWCINISNDIAFNPGWQTFVVDLHNPLAGLTEDAVGEGDCHPRNWKDDPAQWLRLDINENATNSTFHQQIDWIRLSKPDRIRQGQFYPIKFQASEPISNDALTVYYTSDPTKPTQNIAEIPPVVSFDPPGNFRAYLPYNSVKFFTTVQSSSTSNDQILNWDTKNVSPGTYFICLEADDGLNQAIQCSLVPVEVYN